MWLWWSRGPLEDLDWCCRRFKKKCRRPSSGSTRPKTKALVIGRQAQVFSEIEL